MEDGTQPYSRLDEFDIMLSSCSTHFVTLLLICVEVKFGDASYARILIYVFSSTCWKTPFLNWSVYAKREF